MVRQRIAAGANVNAGRKDNRPPLETAARCGHLAVVKELLAAGADINQIASVNCDALPGTALIGAIKQKQFKVALELVQAGASVSLEPYPGCNAASEAALVAMSLRWGCGVAGSQITGMLESAGEMKQPDATFEDWFGFLKLAVAAGAKMNDYCLWKSCQLGCSEVALYLIAIEVDVNVAPHRVTALQEAIVRDLDDVALALVAAGADPNLKGDFQPPPLELALEKEKHRVIQALLKAGAKPAQT